MRSTTELIRFTSIPKDNTHQVNLENWLEKATNSNYKH